MRQSEVNDNIVPAILVTMNDATGGATTEVMPLVNEGSLAWQWVGRTFPTDTAIHATLRLGMVRRNDDSEVTRAKRQEEDSETVFFDDIGLSVGQ